MAAEDRNVMNENGAKGRIIAVRAYPVVVKTEEEKEDTSRPLPTEGTAPKPWIDKWPRRALVFDCETRTDTGQRLTVGFAALVRSDWRIDRHELEALLCFVDEAALSRPELLTVRDWARERLPDVLARIGHELQRVRIPRELPLELVAADEFRERFYRMTAHRGRAAVVGFNLPFDLSRIAVRATPTRDRRGFTFTLIDKVDGRGRHSTKVRHPRIRVEPIDGRRALIRFSGARTTAEEREAGMPAWYEGRFVDLKTLADALTGKRHSLGTACAAFGAGRKGEHHHDGRVTRGLLDYALLDALATAELYVAVLNDHRKHPIAKGPNEVYSEATIGKAYLSAMGLRLPELVIDPGLEMGGVEPTDDGERRNTVLGWATSTYFGGRTECRIRNTLVPVAYLDFLSMYPTVNALQGLWDLLRAERIRIVDATEEVRAFLKTVSADALFDPETWKRLPAIVLTHPDGDVLPTRARHGDEQYSAYGIGVNPLTSDRPLWYALADCVASKLRTGRTPRVLRALCFVPEGRQTLKPVRLRGQVAIDPNAEDFFRAVINERRRVKKLIGPYAALSREEADTLQLFLKILVNAASYGIFMEMNRQKGERATVRAYGLSAVEREVDGPEELGRYCFPPLATAITAAARLMLALAEQEVRSRGGRYAFMDTDSIAVVSTERGGPVPCPGGDHRLPDRSGAVYALSWPDVDAVQARFARLNPYGDADSILELEGENFARCGIEGHAEDCTCTKARRELVCFSTASKRYVLANLEPGRVDIRKYSEHGLGAFEAAQDPATGERIRKWERIVWERLIERALGRSTATPDWAHQTALTQVRISTPEQLRWFASYNAGPSGRPKPYAEAVKPFGFLAHALVRRLTTPRSDRAAADVCLVAPAGERRRFVDRHAPEGTRYEAGVDFLPRTYAELMELHDQHPERKFADAAGAPCSSHTRGLLYDLPVSVDRVKHVGKEGNELDAHRVGIVDEAERQLEYHDSWYEDLVAALRAIPTKALVEATGYNPRTVRRLKQGEFCPSADYLRRVRALLDRPSDESGSRRNGPDEDQDRATKAATATAASLA